MDKQIASAVQKGSEVDVYDERGSRLFSKNGELQGFTSTTVSIKRDSYVTTYDAKGSSKFSKKCS